MFKDRYEAAEQLAKALSGYNGMKDAIILAIPRGALQIGEVLHKRLNLPLDIIITKKIPHPMSEEYAVGAVGPDGEFFVNASAEVSNDYIASKRKILEKMVEERYKLYRGEKPKPKLYGKTVIIVDDGVATGSTILAAIHVIRKQNPKKIVIAVPVGSSEAMEMIKREADEVICISIPDNFFAIGQFYENFVQVEDKEAIGILKRCQ
jgi:predicted phosphoribosyltransferase